MIKGKIVQRPVVILEMDYDTAHDLKAYVQNGFPEEDEETSELRNAIFEGIPIDLGQYPTLELSEVVPPPVHPTIQTMVDNMSGAIEG